MTDPARYQSTILVVDDVEPNRRLLEKLLQRHGYAVLSVADGESALRTLNEASPDLVLLDVSMPGIDGFEVCRRIKAHPEHRLTPVVLVTALHARQHKIMGIEAGADDFVTKPFDHEELVARVRSLLRLKRYTDALESAETVVVSFIGIVEARDAYTEGHSSAVAAHAVALGTHLGLSDEQLGVLARGGYLHDLGKIGVPDTVLQKKGSLTPDEFEIMKQHPTIGEKLCAPLRSLDAVRPLVRSHHERRDGCGYPDGLHGDEIPLLAQIIGVVDVYDAMTSTRPYREALPAAQVCDVLREGAARGFFREDLVDAIVALSRSGALDAARRSNRRPPLDLV